MDTQKHLLNMRSLRIILVMLAVGGRYNDKTVIMDTIGTCNESTYKRKRKPKNASQLKMSASRIRNHATLHIKPRLLLYSNTPLSFEMGLCIGCLL